MGPPCPITSAPAVACVGHYGEALALLAAPRPTRCHRRGGLGLRCLTPADKAVHPAPIHRSTWRNCLENGRRTLDRASSTPGSDRARSLRPLLAAFGTPILRLSRFSKQFRKGYSPKFAFRILDKSCSSGRVSLSSSTPTPSSQHYMLWRWIDMRETVFLFSSQGYG